MLSKNNILVIDDEPQIRKLLRICLESNDYKVREASTGKEGIIQSASHPPDLILLDLGLPDMNGHIILKELRQWYNRPIIILTVQNSEFDIVTALDNGASDYLTKPFRTGELLARIRSAIKRSMNEPELAIVKSGDLEIELSTRTVRKKGEIIKFTSTEYNLLALMAANDGKVLTHQFILKEIWGVGYQNETQYLRVFVAQIRKKIENDPNNPEHIITESGVGYRFR